MNKRALTGIIGLLAVLTAQLVFTTVPAQAALPVAINPVSAGSTSTCAIRASDDLYCVGANSFGQLGNGTLVSSTEPQKVSGITKVSSVSVGTTSACAITLTGALYCWGDNTAGQLGIGSTEAKNVATLVPTLSNVSQVSVGENFACALVTSGALYCWGANDSGQLASNGRQNTYIPTLITQAPSDLKSIAVSGKRICVLGADVYCWGEFASFVFSGVDNWVPTKLTGSTGATAVELGGDFGCITLATSVACWGANDHGQLGNGTRNQSATLVIVSGIGSVRELATGNHFACVTDANSDTFCWGENQFGQLAISQGVDQLTRVPTSAPKSASIDAGLNNVCLLKLDSGISCYGDSAQGQSGFLLSSATPLLNNATLGYAKVSAGVITTCAVDVTGSLRCWGSVIPTVSETLKFSDVSVGNSSACAVTLDKKVWCWGSNSSGQLGNDSSRASNEPVQINQVGNFVSVAVGYRHACAVTEDGLAYCWGDNSHQQLGSIGADSRSPKAVPGFGTASSIAVGDYHSCVQLIGGGVTCWGDNVKKQISSSGTSLLAPTSLVLSNPVTKVSLGSYNTCLLESTKAIKCFGDNAKKQSPPTITGTFSDVAAGANTVCAVKTDESVVCFGAADSGKLGSVIVDTATPTTIAGLVSAKVSVGAAHACSLDSTGKLRCWGSNSSGQLTSSFGFPAAFAIATVVVQGAVSVGDSITASVNSSENVAINSFIWKRANAVDGLYASLTSQTANTYLLTASDVGRYFSVEVKQTKWGITSAGYLSKSVGPIVPPTRLLLTPIPTVSGVAKVGKSLVVSSGRWDAGTTLGIQWYRGSAPIKGATKIRYTLVAADAGKQISVSVTGMKIGLAKVAKKSSKTSKVLR